MNHATVKLGDYTVPLLGVPPDATEETCEIRGRRCHLSEVKLDGEGYPLCPQCHDTTTTL